MPRRLSNRDSKSVRIAFWEKRIRRVRQRLVVLLAIGWFSLCHYAAAQPVVVTNLYTFQGSPDSSYPIWLTYGSGGVLYGITFFGGVNNAGTIFKINSNGTGEKVLHSFGVNEGGGSTFFDLLGNNLTILQGNDGLLYGTTSAGGANGDGMVFKLFPDGSGFTVLHSFTNSDADPISLIQGRDGALYGAGGGIVIFKLDTNGSNYTVMHSGNEGSLPFGLMQGADGALYGTTYTCNSNPFAGTVFKLETNGNYTILHSFTGGTNDGQYPIATPFQASNGVLYGTTIQGGSSNVGIIYMIKTDGSGYQVLHSFGGSGDGASASGRLVQGPGNVLYGTTYAPANRTIFKIGLDGGGYQILSSFSGMGGTGGIGPVGGLTAGPASDGSGAFFGVSATAPTSQNGMFFVMLVNPPVTIMPIAGQTSGGQMVVLWPSWAVGYVLQSTTNLTTPNWTAVSNAVPLTGAQVTNNLPATYFRLVWP